MNTHSDDISELAVALAKAQAENGIVIKDAANPFFKSKYATLASVWEAVRPALTKHGLSIVQMPSHDEHGYYVETMMIHGSGQWIKNRTYMKVVKDDPQGVGSLISYARRYALQAMTMVCPEDDDGEIAMGRMQNVQQQKPTFTKAEPEIKVAKKEEPKPVKQEEPKVESGTSKFNGPSHQELFQALMKAGHTQDDFMAAMRHSGAIPAAAKDYFAMKEGTADKFLKELEKTTNVIIEWKALVK